MSKEVYITKRNFINGFNNYLYANNKELIEKIVNELKKENIESSNILFDKILNKLDFYNFIPKNQIRLLVYLFDINEKNNTIDFSFAIGKKWLDDCEYTQELIENYEDDIKTFYDDYIFEYINDYLYYDDEGIGYKFTYNYANNNKLLTFGYGSNITNINKIIKNNDINRYKFYTYNYLIYEIAINFLDLIKKDSYNNQYCYLMYNDNEIIESDFNSKDNVINFKKFNNNIFTQIDNFYCTFKFDIYDLYAFDDNCEDAIIELDTKLKTKNDYIAFSYL